MPNDMENPAPGEDGAGLHGASDDSTVSDNDSNQPPAVQPEVPRALQLTDAEEERRQELLAAALNYAGDLHWRVIPLCWPDGEGGCGFSDRKHADCGLNAGKKAFLPKWQDVATNDVATAARWWTPPDQWSPRGDIFSPWYPLASIGVVLGEGSGVFVLDVDPDRGGLEELARLQREHGPLPLTRAHATGGGGIHYFFKWPGFRVHNLHPWGDVGLDIKGDNGYVVVPPSRSGKGDYTISAAMERAPIAEAPEWILTLLRRDATAQHGERVSGPEVLPSRILSAYVESAKKGEFQKLAMAPGGNRNNQLNESAFSLGTLGAHGLIDQDEAQALLQEAATRNGYIQQDGYANFLGTFISGWRAGMKQPRDLSEVGSVLFCGLKLPWTICGLGERYALHFGDRITWVNDWGAWMFYSGGMWHRRNGRAGREYARRYASTMIRKIMLDEAELYDETPPGGKEDPPRKKFRDWRHKQEQPAAISGCVEEASHLNVMASEPKHFDDKPLLLNAANGVIDLGTLKLDDHNPETMLTMQCPVPYRPDALCPRWSEFLARVQPDERMRDYLQRVAFYSVTGFNSEQAFFLHHGIGANGKSVFHKVMELILGSYAQTVPVEALMATPMDRIPNDIARMQGKRYLIASETKSGKQLDLGRLKQLTGGDSMAVRFMRGEYFEFRPVGKIHLTTNHLPRITEDDVAVWRRIHLIPWTVQIPKEEQEEELAQWLFDHEAAGILAWVARGSLTWGTSQFLAPPETAELAKSEYRAEENSIQQWVIERCKVVEGSDKLFTGGTRDVLYLDYKEWAKRYGYLPVGLRNWLSEMRRLSFKEIRTHEQRGFAGIALMGTLSAAGE